MWSDLVSQTRPMMQNRVHCRTLCGKRHGVSVLHQGIHSGNESSLDYLLSLFHGHDPEQLTSGDSKWLKVSKKHPLCLWIGLRANLQEIQDIPMIYRRFLHFLSWNLSMIVIPKWTKKFAKQFGLLWTIFSPASQRTWPRSLQLQIENLPTPAYHVHVTLSSCQIIWNPNKMAANSVVQLPDII